MIVQIKEYSFKTGKGIAISPEGELISFSYKRLKDQKAIPVGKKAVIKNGILSPAPMAETAVFYLLKSIKKARGTLWQ